MFSIEQTTRQRKQRKREEKRRPAIGLCKNSADADEWKRRREVNESTERERKQIGTWTE
jgi:hypothetical protein